MTSQSLEHVDADAPRPVDVLVLGGGMAGVFAACAARRADVNVLIVEPSNVLGGQGTAGGVAGFCGDTAHVNHLFQELIDRLAHHRCIAPLDPTADRRPYELEWCAFFLQEMVHERDIDVLLHTMVLDASLEAGRVEQVTLATPEGVMRVRPRVVIDATGRCIVAVKTGLAVEHKGRCEQLPMSLYFTLWDTHQPVTPILPPGCPSWANDEELPMTSLHLFDNGKVEVKMKVVGFDGADALSLSQAEMFARRQMMGLVYYLQTHGYAGQRFPRHALASSSRRIGIREERRIVGVHTLSEVEVTHGAVFDDAVAVGTYHLDYHWPDRLQRGDTGITTMVEPYHIPLRCMIPRGARNVLVPGRGAAGDQMAMSSFRVMATVAQMGYATGLAAAQSVEQRADVTDIDVPCLQKRLQSDGQSLNLSHYGQYLRQRQLIHEHAFAEDRPFASAHASTVGHLANNRFLVAYFAGTREKHDDVGIWLSERWQGGWSAPRRVAKVNDLPHWNPVLFPSPAGPLLLYFKVGPSCDNWATWVMQSDDEGRTWSAPRELAPGSALPRGPVRNKPIVLSDGTVLAPGSDETNRVWRAFVDISEDGGLSYKPGEPLPLDTARIKGPGVIQPTLWESAPGHVHMLLRSTGKHVCRSDSNDGGRTWSDIQPIDLPNPNSGIDAVRLADGTVALVCNPVPHGRSPLSILLSQDNGRTWPHRRDLETEPGEYSYPAIIETPVGMAITYTWRRERIAFWQGSVEQIK
ncbi:MAG: FAD-dependent oxidoreductase [Phycisphaeraceae bacterium]